MSKKLVIVGGVLLILCLVVVFLRFGRGGEDTWVCDPQAGWVKHGHPSAPAPTIDCKAQNTVPDNVSITSTAQANNMTAKRAAAPNATAKTPVLSYTELIKKYDGYRFQFSDNCAQVTPNFFVIKSGYTFMLDNRENKTHIFIFDKQKYTVKPYGYAVATAKSLGNQSVLCDGSQRAVVNVQK